MISIINEHFPNQEPTELKISQFPCGESHIKIPDNFTILEGSIVQINFDFQRREEIIDLLLVADAIKRRGGNKIKLMIPYIPFGRQDRVCNYGESFSLKVFCDLINSIDAESVVVFDPHSDVTTALINNCQVITQHAIFRNHFFHPVRKNNFFLISPDGGALKKIYKLAELVEPIDVIECSKIRNLKTGEILKTVVNYNADFTGQDCYIVDDICDGGRTFIEIAKELKKKDVGKIILMVTHGFFTKGLEVFDGLIDHIITRKGIIK